MASADFFTEYLRRGTMLVGLYAPVGADEQEAHEQDEVYIVAEGSGEFVRGDERFACGAGDVLYVGAGVPHRFVDFENLKVWVVFYGPKGGEHAGGTG